MLSDFYPKFKSYMNKLKTTVITHRYFANLGVFVASNLRYSIYNLNPGQVLF